MKSRKKRSKTKKTATVHYIKIFGGFLGVSGFFDKEATEDRKKALAIAEEVLKQPQQDFFPHKECYYIAGAMSYLIKDYEKAKKHFNDGLKIDYTTKQMSAEEAQEYNKYLNKLLQEYLKKLE